MGSLFVHIQPAPVFPASSSSLHVGQVKPAKHPSVLDGPSPQGVRKAQTEGPPLPGQWFRWPTHKPRHTYLWWRAGEACAQ